MFSPQSCQIKESLQFCCIFLEQKNEYAIDFFSWLWYSILVEVYLEGDFAKAESRVLIRNKIEEI